jgi:undecaprenyl diphosphate synthase
MQDSYSGGGDGVAAAPVAAAAPAPAPPDAGAPPPPVAPRRRRSGGGGDARAAAAKQAIADALAHRLDPRRIPEHVAIIMDGNGRWARQRGLPRLLGHRQGYRNVRQVVRDAADLGIRVLTLYVFSAENWKRPPHETAGLMRLIEEATRRELGELHENGVRFRVSGRTDGLPASLQREIRRNEEATAGNRRLILNLCINYGGRAEILDAARRLVEMAARQQLTAEDVTAERFAEGLYTHGLPDPDLLIRTAGEMRVSNYLLWQIAYSEIWVTPAFWPDFSTHHLIEALADFQGRVRKFGGVVDK